MAREIMHRDECLEETWERWHNTDPREIPKNLLHTLKRGTQLQFAGKVTNVGSEDPNLDDLW